jgi:hypothetical protein
MSPRAFAILSAALAAAAALLLAYTSPRAGEAPILVPVDAVSPDQANTGKSALETCIAETAELVAKTVKLQELRHANNVMKRAAESGNGGLVAVVKGIAAPLEAEQKAAERMMSTTADLKTRGIETCHVRLLLARLDWVCPRPHLYTPDWSAQWSKAQKCGEQWVASLAASDRELLDIEDDVWAIGRAYYHAGFGMTEATVTSRADPPRSAAIVKAPARDYVKEFGKYSNPDAIRNALKPAKK